MQHLIKSILFLTVVSFSFAQEVKVIDVKYAESRIRILKTELADQNKTLEMLQADNKKMADQIVVMKEQHKKGTELRQNCTAQLSVLFIQIKNNRDFEVKSKLQQEFDELGQQNKLVDLKISNLANLISVREFEISENNKKIENVKSKIDYSEKNIKHLEDLLSKTTQFSSGVDAELKKSVDLKTAAAAFLKE